MVAPGIWRATRPGITWGTGLQIGTAPETEAQEDFRGAGGDVALNADWTFGAEAVSWLIAEDETSGTPGSPRCGYLNLSTGGGGGALWLLYTRTFTGFDPEKFYHVWARMKRSGIGGGTTTFRVTFAGLTSVELNKLGGDWTVERPPLDAPVQPTAEGEITVTVEGRLQDASAAFRDLYLDDITIESRSVVTPSMLRFGYPADAVIAGPVLRGDSARVTRRSGLEDVARGSVLRRLRCDCRWIPPVDGTTREGHPVTGWEGIGSWERFLEHAWGGDSFLFHPDQDDPDTAWTSWLEEPAPCGRAEPYFELEPDGSRRLSLSFLSLVPYAGW